jgi:predicted hydrocarbon binding protein
LERGKPVTNAFEIDSEKGTIRNTSLESRVAVFGSLGWALMEVELDSIFITGAVVIIQRMGYSYGKYLGQLFKRKADKVDPVSTALSEFVKVAKESGWGNFSHTGGDIRMGTFTVVARDCIFCANVKKRKDSRCHFLVGVLAGLADEVTGVNHRAREEACIAKEDTYCEFIVERVAEQTQTRQF